MTTVQVTPALAVAKDLDAHNLELARDGRCRLLHFDQECHAKGNRSR
jgi:hypothetical protein